MTARNIKTGVTYEGGKTFIGSIIKIEQITVHIRTTKSTGIAHFVLC